jgi:hypothetical protein
LHPLCSTKDQTGGWRSSAPTVKNQKVLYSVDATGGSWRKNTRGASSVRPRNRKAAWTPFSRTHAAKRRLFLPPLTKLIYFRFAVRVIAAIVIRELEAFVDRDNRPEGPWGDMLKRINDIAGEYLP